MSLNLLLARGFTRRWMGRKNRLDLFNAKRLLAKYGANYAMSHSATNVVKVPDLS